MSFYLLFHFNFSAEKCWVSAETLLSLIKSNLIKIYIKSRSINGLPKFLWWTVLTHCSITAESAKFYRIVNTSSLTNNPYKIIVLTRGLDVWTHSGLFLMRLGHSVPIFNKKSHRTWAMETFKIGQIRKFSQLMYIAIFC